jgi:Matrixin/Putative peptidoglycan binding domain
MHRNLSVQLRPSMRLGDTGDDVRLLQEYLRRFGFRVVSPDGVFDDDTRSALEHFQLRHGLDPTGELDTATHPLVGTPRCGNVDVDRYAIDGRKWDRFRLTYAFQEFGNVLTPPDIRAAIIQAMALWSAETPLRFTEIALGNNPDIVIRFVRRSHGDGYDFDGRGNVLAHAFYPPPNGGTIAGDAHFDDEEQWFVNSGGPGTDLVTVAAHEFGHSLGLGHSSERAALMFAYYLGPHRFLDTDDRNGIRALYPDPWVRELDNVQSFQLEWTRIGALVAADGGTLFVKEGELAALWVRELDNVQSFQLEGSRIGVLTPESNGTLHVKEGDLHARWVRELDNVQSFQLEGSRIGVLTHGGQLFVKQGSLGAAWATELGLGEVERLGIQSFKLRGTRIAIHTKDGQLFMRDLLA